MCDLILTVYLLGYWVVSLLSMLSGKAMSVAIMLASVRPAVVSKPTFNSIFDEGLMWLGSELKDGVSKFILFGSVKFKLDSLLENKKLSNENSCESGSVNWEMFKLDWYCSKLFSMLSDELNKNFFIA